MSFCFANWIISTSVVLVGQIPSVLIVYAKETCTKVVAN